ncbi:MAG: Rieske 2Fe-2S domain-containing protein [Cyanobacteria bacterium P01_A01_bin.84]
MEQENVEIFEWTKQWYPIAVVAFLNPSHPHAMQLLGKDIVLWRSGSGQWCCFEDACPHRLVPLSEGRIESDGTLLCAYHAWRFDSSGKCVSIPQSKDKQTETRNLSNNRSCTVTYPTQECQGLLWVWFESGSQAQVESQLKQLPLISELESNSSNVKKLFWYVRDLPYGWEFLMENLLDPAHVPVSHHGITGNRYKDAKYYDMVLLSDISTQDSFAYEMIPTEAGLKQVIRDFKAPCLVKVTCTYDNNSQLILYSYNIPTCPGWSRQIGCQVLVKNDKGKQAKGMSFYSLPLPIWLTHVLTSFFLHQDLVFLHYQEKNFAKRKKDKWSNIVYTPNPQDKMVIAFRQWLLNRSGGTIPWFPECNLELPSAERDKQKLFDVWTTHTRGCTVCQNALKNINRIKNLAYVISVICFCLGIILDARAMAMKAALTTVGQISATITPTLSIISPTVELCWAMGGAVLFALVGYSLNRFSRLFYVYEFKHAHND